MNMRAISKQPFRECPMRIYFYFPLYSIYQIFQVQLLGIRDKRDVRELLCRSLSCNNQFFLHLLICFFVWCILRATLLIFRDFNVWRNVWKGFLCSRVVEKCSPSLYFGKRCLSLWSTFFRCCLFSMSIFSEQIAFPRKNLPQQFTKLFD